ncbi:DUF92 domain-containing protein [Bacillus massilinigeriensis]|uniref:DUF92 domain-containing protein n=1 Tax=Bacillus massilionigeriensis TaxID=1805475 RepID=UPI00096B19B9|nr:DUF92 domain-containing protein [Bacillus massilionigeriensis]
MIKFILPTLIIMLMAFGGYSARLLTKSGMFAAMIVGFIVYFSIGIKGFILMGVFFISSSVWSKYKRMQKNKIEEKHAKGSRRDMLQVFANGGMASLACLIYIVSKDPLWIIVYCSAIACSNSDTWASEIGSLSRNSPIYVRNFRKVEPGTSGAVSMLGTFAAFCGALLIAVISYLLFHLTVLTASVILIFGFLGNVIDTILGAFFQARYSCIQCGLSTEKTVHCGKKTRIEEGFTWLNNDMVNFLASFAAAFFTYLFYKI